MGGGPLLRAQSARWLCFAAGTAAAALRHANVLCREFALGELGSRWLGGLALGWAGMQRLLTIGGFQDPACPVVP